jgi:hypothetical protein
VPGGNSGAVFGAFSSGKHQPSGGPEDAGAGSEPNDRDVWPRGGLARRQQAASFAIQAD